MARARAPQRTRRGTAGARGAARTAANGEPKRRDDDVLAAAIKVFYDQGYANATVQDVADELGILKGSLYHYIDTKEDLLFRILEQVHEEVQAILLRVTERDDLAPLEQLDLYVREQVVYNVRNLPKVSVYYHDVDRLGPERRDVIYARRREHEHYVTRLIEQAQEAGEADPTLDAQTLSKCIFGTVIWTYRWYRPRGKLKRDEIAETCARFVLRGVVGGDGSADGR